MDNNKAPNRWRGHAIEKLPTKDWAYVDTQELVKNNPDRPCGHCGLSNTPEGYDGCLGHIEGAQNACCGHGEESIAYIQFKDKHLEGKEVTQHLGTIL